MLLLIKIKLFIYKFLYENFHMFDNSNSSVGVLIKNGKVLLLKRSPESKTYKNCYCFPGGHKDSGETNISAVIREFYEETGIKITVDKFFYRFKTPGGYCNVYIVSAENFNVVLSNEHTDYIWFDLNQTITFKAGKQTQKVVKYLKNYDKLF